MEALAHGLRHASLDRRVRAAGRARAIVRLAAPTPWPAAAPGARSP